MKTIPLQRPDKKSAEPVRLKDSERYPPASWHDRARRSVDPPAYPTARPSADYAAPVGGEASAVVIDQAGRPSPRDYGSAKASDSRAAYPVSSWYLLPLVRRLATILAPTRLRPWHLTAGGLIAASAAATVMVTAPAAAWWVAGLVWMAWFCDRADGQLARAQGTASRLGAWLDANVDELVDMLLHVAIAIAAVEQASSGWPAVALVGFVAGKYLFMYGLMTEEHFGGCPDGAAAARSETVEPTIPLPQRWDLLRTLYHAPANADLRVHLVLAGILGGWAVAELVLIGVYYNLRWSIRYVLVARRLREFGRPPSPVLTCPPASDSIGANP